MLKGRNPKIDLKKTAIPGKNRVLYPNSALSWFKLYNLIIKQITNKRTATAFLLGFIALKLGIQDGLQAVA